MLHYEKRQAFIADPTKLTKAFQRRREDVITSPSGDVAPIHFEATHSFTLEPRSRHLEAAIGAFHLKGDLSCIIWICLGDSIVVLHVEPFLGLGRDVKELPVVHLVVDGFGYLQPLGSGIDDAQVASLPHSFYLSQDSPLALPLAKEWG